LKKNRNLSIFHEVLPSQKFGKIHDLHSEKHTLRVPKHKYLDVNMIEFVGNSGYYMTSTSQGLYSSLNTVWTLKSVRIQWDGYEKNGRGMKYILNFCGVISCGTVSQNTRQIQYD
jgi:hypothetical protein